MDNIPTSINGGGLDGHDSAWRYMPYWCVSVLHPLMIIPTIALTACPPGSKSRTAEQPSQPDFLV